MPGRALTTLVVGSVLSRALPLGTLIRVVEAAAGRFGPWIQRAKADQLHRHMQRVMVSAEENHEEQGPGSSVPVLADDPDAQTVRGFRSYGRYWVEFFRLPYLTDRELDRGFSFVGYGKIEAVRAAGVGPILVLPHLGGWEWAAAWLGRIAKVEVTAVVERLEPEEVYQWFFRLRQALGVNVVPLGPRAMVDLVAAVKRRSIVCLLSDRDIGGNGIGVQFFGEETTLPVGPALLARRAEAPIMPVGVFFRGRQRVCIVGDPIWPADLATPGLSGRDLNKMIMQRVAAGLEALIRQAPDQWHLLEPNWPSDTE